jgi:hypothetical protein
VSVFSPSAVHISLSPTDQVKYFVSLDVCNASGSFMSANADTPSLHECPCKPVPFEFAAFFETNASTFALSLFSVQVERPPRI